MDFEIYLVIVLVIILTLLYFLKDQILGLVSTIEPQDEKQAEYLKKVTKGIEKASEGAKVLGEGAKDLGVKAFEQSKIAANKAWEFAKSEEAKTIAGQIKSGLMSGFETSVDFTADLLNDVCSEGPRKSEHTHHHCGDCGRVIAEPSEIVQEGVVNKDWLLENA
ncbi:MAG: hypothetical protein ACRCZI_13140 [Cetobacterium sp.]